MNWIKDRFDPTSLLAGIWLSSGSAVAAEMAALAGFDWALVDMEHGLGDTADLLRQIQALSGPACPPVVRVPSSTSELIPKVLDFGASGVMAPMVESAAQAAAFVRALRYPPGGTRGLSRSNRAGRYGYDFESYFQHANAAVLAVAQIETAQAVEQADAIASTDGVDVLFLGHSDLSLALGCLGQPDAPVLRDAENAVLQACERHGKRAGMLLKAGMALEPYRRRGFTFVALGSDVGCLKQGFDALRRMA